MASTTSKGFRPTANNNSNNHMEPSSRRTVQAKGKRTGVTIHSTNVTLQANGLEDIDAFFAQHPSSPQPEKENPRRAKFTRFSIGSQQQDADYSIASSHHNNNDITTTKRLVRKMGGLLSPSDLSRVSTLSEKVVEEEEEQVPLPPSPPREEEEEDEPLTQQPAQEEEEEDEEPLTQQPAEEEEEEEPLVMAKDNEEVDATNEASVVEDDFMPPGPPDSPERDDGTEIPTQNDDPVEDIKTQLSTQEEEESEDEEDSPGYAMPTTKTPQSAKVLRKEKKKRKHKDKEKKASKKRKKVQITENSDEEQVEEKTQKKKTTKKKSKWITVFEPKGIPLPMEYETVPVDNLRQTDQVDVDGKPCRRSKRARCPPLAYWKNEKLMYGPSDMDDNSDLAKMPVPKAVIKAKPTPYKPRPVRHVVPASAKKHKGGSSSPTPREAPLAEFDSSRLRTKYKYEDGQETDVWDEVTEKSTEMKVVAFKNQVQYRNLPNNAPRTKSEGNVVAKAGQAFRYDQQPDSAYVGYIMGHLVLPPKGIKDSESVGVCHQTFTIVTGQPGAIEVAYADPQDNGVFKAETAIRFLLGPGDMFRVPSANCYRIRNHSKTTECFMTWTIIRADASATDDDEP